MMNEERPLSTNPTLQELFDFIQVDEGVRVLPVTVRQTQEDTRLFIAIQGEHEMASFMMAELMAHVNNLYDLSQQAIAGADNGESAS